METVTLIHSRWPKDEFIYEPSTGENIDDVDDLTAEERGALYAVASLLNVEPGFIDAVLQRTTKPLD